MWYFLPLLFTALCGTAFAKDWPQWRGPDRTGHAPKEEAALTTLPSEPKEIWRRPIGEGFASPVVSAGRVVYLDDESGQEIVHAVDSRTGEEIWRAPLFSSHRDGFGIGPRCTPVIDGDRVFAQSAKGEFQCLSVADGKRLWRTNFVDDFGAIYTGEKGKAAGASRHGASGSPLVDGHRVIVQVGSPKGASIVAFEKSTGKVLWKSQNDQTAYAAPIIAELAGVRQFISFTAEGLIALNPATGELLWRVPLETSLGRHVTTPVVCGDLVLVASHQIGLVAIRVQAVGGKIEATEAWRNKALGINFSSPVVLGESLYGLGPQKNFICVNARSGEVAWSQEGIIQSSADKAEAGFLVIGTNLLALTDSGELVLFAGDASSFRELGRLQVCGTNWCNPAYVDGLLYLRDHRELICVGLR